MTKQNQIDCISRLLLYLLKYQNSSLHIHNLTVVKYGKGKLKRHLRSAYLEETKGQHLDQFLGRGMIIMKCQRICGGVARISAGDSLK